MNTFVVYVLAFCASQSCYNHFYGGENNESCEKISFKYRTLLFFFHKNFCWLQNKEKVKLKGLEISYQLSLIMLLLNTAVSTKLSKLSKTNIDQNLAP